MRTLEEMFFILDTARKGFVTAEQIKDFFESTHICTINLKHVIKSIEWVVGPNGKVIKAKFSQVLEELSRRKEVEDKAQWDFMGLDKFGSSRISVSDALLLFQITHGNEFLIDFWHQFIESRGDLGTTVPVSFDEIYMWLCDHPSERPNKDEDEPDTAEEEIARLEEDYEMALDNEIAKLIQKTDEEILAEKDWQEKKNNRLAVRKLGLWEQHGLSDFLDDEGIDDMTEDIAQPAKKGVSLIFDLMNLKYDLLRERVIILMAEGDMGSGIWISSSPAQQKAALRKISTTEKQLRRNRQLNSSSHAIPGSNILLRDYDNLLGKLGEELRAEEKSLNIRRRDMRQGGSKDDDIEDTFKRMFEEVLNSRMNCGDVLVLLENRQEKERKQLLSIDSSLLSEYHGRLAAQITSLRRFDHPETCALSVGLLERNQVPMLTLFEADHLRQEKLALWKMEEDFKRRVDPVGDDLISHIIDSISNRFIKEHSELLSIIKSLPYKIQSTDNKEKEKKMAILQNDRQNWRESNDDLRLKNRNKQLEIFVEACQLFFMDIEREKGILKVNTLLQLQQHLDFDRVVKSLRNLSEKELKVKYTEEEKRRTQNDLDNIASILLNQGNVTEEEKPFMTSIEVKYTAIKAVVLKHGLRFKMGPLWERISPEEQNNLWMKSVKDETAAREKDDPNAFPPILDKLGSKLENLNFYMGPIRGGTQADPNNFLYDIIVRMRMEQEAVLNYLRKNGNDSILLVAIRLEAWKALKEDTSEISALSVGLAERVLHEPDENDRSRQELLAKNRYKYRQKRFELGHAWQREENESQVESGIDSWRRAYLVEMSKKHREEIEFLLYVLQDPDMEGLIEAAIAYGEIEREKRLCELSFKRKSVNEDFDRRMELIEEAAAIRVACKLGEDQTHNSFEEIAYSIVADVQEAQDRELRNALKNLGSQDMDDLNYKRGREIDYRNDHNLHNVLDVLTKYVGELSDESILKALEDRQKALEELLVENCPKDIRDKLINDFEEEKRLLLDKLRGNWASFYPILIRITLFILSH